MFHVCPIAGGSAYCIGVLHMILTYAHTTYSSMHIVILYDVLLVLVLVP